MPIRKSEKIRYPDNWPEIRAKIRTRAGDRCEWCGVRNHTYRAAANQSDDAGCVHSIKIVCTVAHLDHTPENCADDNLAFLCQRCHNRYDAQTRAAGRKERAAQIDGQQTLL